MELKTLKDIKGIFSNGKGGLGPLHIRESELKQEAIKWVKSDDCFYLKDNPEPIIMDEARDVFIRFFNITEDDLQ